MFSYFLLTAYRVAKLNKNSFYVSRSRLGGDTENSSCKGGAHILQLSRNLLGITHVYAQDNRAKYLLRSCVRKCVSYRTCDVSTNGK